MSSALLTDAEGAVSLQLQTLHLRLSSTPGSPEGEGEREGLLTRELAHLTSPISTRSRFNGLLCFFCQVSTAVLSITAKAKKKEKEKEKKEKEEEKMEVV